jgi:hypothetical protein
MGARPSPAIKEILDQVLRAKLNGEAPDRSSQLDLAKKLIAARS